MPPKSEAVKQRLTPLPGVQRDLSQYMDLDSLDEEEKERYSRMMSGHTASVLASSPASEARSPDEVLREMSSVSGVSREDSITLPEDIEARRAALKAIVAGHGRRQ
eukprot:CAMPEP_0114146692 /NCGR_PEP_ID=MMETSP0043_2-20121206/20701_1 /TAXON_ID=464988 /ORGANISM="Hemiselmis andersenii, Strain CCMP644" /LENGTH=105 /DNA_ID=CAMNT_0001241165 /DNA_START=213 /DNA_END=527 /DNA_ORIENTATION=-